MTSSLLPIGHPERTIVHLKGEQTGGRFALLEMVVAWGEEWPCHLHHWEDETLYVLSGTVTVQLVERCVPLAAGEALLLPRGLEHTFTVTSGEARVLTLLTPSGFEGLYQELGKSPAGVGMERLVTMAARYGCEITGPPTVLHAV